MHTECARTRGNTERERERERGGGGGGNCSKFCAYLRLTK